MDAADEWLARICDRRVTPEPKFIAPEPSSSLTDDLSSVSPHRVPSTKDEVCRTTLIDSRLSNAAMRTLALSILLSPLALAACDKDDPKRVDAAITIIDAPKPIDAAIDSPPPPPDAPNMNVVTACMHVCDAIAVCLMEPVEPDCYSGCAEDLGDCTAQQVATIDACSTEMCGDIKNEMSPLFDCVIAVPCVNGAMAPVSNK
jgi:hypothetical protein